MKNFCPKIFQFLAGAALLVPSVLAQIPLDITGAITANSLSLDSGTDPLRGGSITVDGIKVIVPVNTLVTLPSITVAWPELFVNGVADLPGGNTWQAHVQGNTLAVNGVQTNVAGLVYISQSFFQSLSGEITSIDTTTGHFTIGVSNIDCVLNDPIGRFGLPHSGNELWTVDPDNPSIRATNGFPLCIPRSANDGLCPAENRPNNAKSFTFKDPATITATDPDPNLMAPLLVGDFVTVSGTEIGGTLWVSSLVANLGIFTAAGTKPAYVTCEEAIFGVVTTQAGEIAETRAVAWTTDVGGGLMDWFALDQNECDGTITPRNLRVPMQPNSGVAPLGRAVYRSPAKVDLTPATRNVGFKMQSGTVVTKNNLTAGQFIQPVFDYVFPELLVAGDPELAMAFDTIPFLAKGSGLYVPGRVGFALPSTPVTVGQLSPWPGGAAPVAAPSACPVVIATPTPTPTPASTSSSAAATSTTPPPRDTIVITSATGRNQKGSTTLTVTATTTSKDPNVILSITAAGQNPVGKTAMTLVSPGNWSFTISVKNKPLTVTVTSNFGGGPITANVA